MIKGVFSYLKVLMARKLIFLSSLFLVFIDALWCRLTFSTISIDYYAQNAYLFHYITQKDDFRMVLWSMRWACWLRNKRSIRIHITRLNYLYFSEMINHCLSVLNIEGVDILKYLDLNESGITRGYFKLIETLNRQLEAQDIHIDILKDDFEIIKNTLEAIEARLRICPVSPQKGFHALWEVFEKVKALPISFLMTSRYLSLCSENITAGPGQVVLDIYHKCNTDCVHCWMHSPTSRKFLTKDFLSQEMDFQRVKGIVDDCSEMGVDAITILGDGEPVLNPDFLKILWHIKRRNHFINVLTFSNGLAVPPSMSRQMINAGLDEIWFSVPAATPETYQIVCPSKTAKDFIRIQLNIAYLCRLKRLLNRLKCFSNGVRKFNFFEKNINIRNPRHDCFLPYCVIAFVLHNKNCHEIEKMAHMAVELGVDEMRFQLIHLDKDNKHLQLEQSQIDMLNEKFEAVKAIAEKGRVVLSASLKFQLSHMHVQSGDWSPGYYLSNGCPIGFFFSIIKANGDVGLCCGLKVIDTLNHRSFRDIWQSAEYRRGRVGAKHLAQNMDMEFLKTHYHKDEKRGDLLYSERCEYCDNHDQNNDIILALERIGLAQSFMKKD